MYDLNEFDSVEYLRHKHLRTIPSSSFLFCILECPSVRARITRQWVGVGVLKILIGELVRLVTDKVLSPY